MHCSDYFVTSHGTMLYVNVKERVINKLVTAPSLRNPTPNMQQVKEIGHDSIAGECKVIYKTLSG